MLYFFLLLPLLFIVGIIHCTKHRPGASKGSNVTQPSETESKELSKPLQQVQKENSGPVESKTLVEEEPYAAIVNRDFLTITCSKCFAWNIEEEEERVPLTSCSGCKAVYYCSSKCREADWNDHKEECNALNSPDGSLMLDDSHRLILRIVMKSKSQPDWKAFNGRTYDSLMGHCEEQRKDEDRMEYVKKMFTDFKSCMGRKAPDFESIFQAFAKQSINGFAIKDGAPIISDRGSGLYIGLSVLNHSCRPSAFVISQGSKLLLKSTDIQATYSDQLTIAYTSVGYLNTTGYRRYFLQQAYYFTCMCEECVDVEQDHMRTSGRPKCCPNGWFALSDLRCSVCKKDVDPELGELAKEHNKRLSWILVSLVNALIGRVWDEFINVFEQSRTILSDGNTFLIGLAFYIFVNGPDLEIRLKFGDICLPTVRSLPFDDERSRLLYLRYSLVSELKKPYSDEMDARREALEAAVIAYGSNHEHTLNVKMPYKPRTKKLRRIVQNSPFCAVSPICAK